MHCIRFRRSRPLAWCGLVLFLLSSARGQEPPATQEAAASRESAETAPASRPGEQTESRDAAKDRPPKPRRGLPVREPLVHQFCATCHKVTGDDLMGRISYMRKSPEGWELSLKRMIRHHQIEMTPDEARQIVRYLANDHGLARPEAARGLYEPERRVHWSEEKSDEDMRKSCAACHSLGRVHAEQRDDLEWKYLKATHLAFFPLAEFQAFRGGRRGGGDESPIDWENMSEAEIEEAMERRREAEAAKGDRADRVLGKLAKEQPLFTPEWDSWQVNRREVPLEGTWTLVGREPGRTLGGIVAIRRSGEDSFETTWSVRYGDGELVERHGKGLLYAGYSWRGRSEAAASGANGGGLPDAKQTGTNGGGDTKTLKEVLLLSEDWNRFEGRVFAGAYSELGADVVLHRHIGISRVLAVENGALAIPSQGNTVEVWGESFADHVLPADFGLGRDVTVVAAERLDDRHVRLTVDVARTADRGGRSVTFRATQSPAFIVLHDTIDYLEIVPGQGLARVGGAKHPKQLERFEALAMNRGADDLPYTADDFVIETVPAAWSLEEFPVRENDDDVLWVGEIHPRTGLFTPNIDGPNLERRWQANNVGDVYVVATMTRRVHKIPKKTPPAAPASAPATAPASSPAAAEAPAESAPSRPADEPIEYEDKTFRARAHLLVSVPLYIRQDHLEWEER